MSQNNSLSPSFFMFLMILREKFEFRKDQAHELFRVARKTARILFLKDSSQSELLCFLFLSHSLS